MPEDPTAADALSEEQLAEVPEYLEDELEGDAPAAGVRAPRRFASRA